MARSPQFPISAGDVDQIVAVVLDAMDAREAEAKGQGGGLSRTEAASVANTRRAARLLGVQYGTPADPGPAPAPGILASVAESDEGKYEASA